MTDLGICNVSAFHHYRGRMVVHVFFRCGCRWSASGTRAWGSDYCLVRHPDWPRSQQNWTAAIGRQRVED
jgi:hypothetical protein